tara:strand:- start:139 stop:378 length:240 start_codon:yes stop_codon:yes gene_type:complete
MKAKELIEKQLNGELSEYFPVDASTKLNNLINKVLPILKEAESLSFERATGDFAPAFSMLAEGLKTGVDTARVRAKKAV